MAKIAERNRVRWDPTKSFSSDALSEFPRQHAIYTLEFYAKARVIPPQWAIDRLKGLPAMSSCGRPRKNELVDLIRSLAVVLYARRHRGDKYKGAERLLRLIPTRLFCGLAVAAGSSQIKKSHLSSVGPEENEFIVLQTTAFILRLYLPLLVEAIDKGTRKPSL